ncbi:MAG: Flp family type IVb pilin [Thermoguttaceae bacterium]
MKWLTRKIVRFLRADNGPTAVEYGVMLALVIIVCMTAIAVFGNKTGGSLEHSSEQIQASMEH